jgi:antitoxin component of RelBE/YafQ-DinJ toxin-antitoxin module
MSDKKVMVGCRVPIALKDEIDSTARSMDCTPSQVIQIAIEQYLGIESADLPTSRMTTIEEQIQELRTIVEELQNLATKIPVVKDSHVDQLEKTLNQLPENLVVGEKVLNDRRYGDSRDGKHFLPSLVKSPLDFRGSSEKSESSASPRSSHLPWSVSGSSPKIEEILTEAELLDRFDLSQNWRSSAPHGWVHEHWLAQKLGVEYLGNDRYQLS